MNHHQPKSKITVIKIMKHIDLSDEKTPGDCRRGGLFSTTVRAQTLPSGDVEIVRSNKSGDEKLTVIPKSKRAELAQFLVEAE
jgi:hypothetical protein